MAELQCGLGHGSPLWFDAVQVACSALSWLAGARLCLVLALLPGSDVLIVKHGRGKLPQQSPSRLFGRFAGHWGMIASKLAW